jgi:hypothetical protein
MRMFYESDGIVRSPLGGGWCHLQVPMGEMVTATMLALQHSSEYLLKVR